MIFIYIGLSQFIGEICGDKTEQCKEFFRVVMRLVERFRAILADCKSARVGETDCLKLLPYQIIGGMISKIIESAIMAKMGEVNGQFNPDRLRDLISETGFGPQSLDIGYLREKILQNRGKSLDRIIKDVILPALIENLKKVMLEKIESKELLNSISPVFQAGGIIYKVNKICEAYTISSHEEGWEQTYYETEVEREEGRRFSYYNEPSYSACIKKTKSYFEIEIINPLKDKLANGEIGAGYFISNLIDIIGVENLITAYVVSIGQSVDVERVKRGFELIYRLFAMNKAGFGTLEYQLGSLLQNVLINPNTLGDFVELLRFFGLDVGGVFSLIKKVIEAKNYVPQELGELFSDSDSSGCNVMGCIKMAFEGLRNIDHCVAIIVAQVLRLVFAKYAKYLYKNLGNSCQINLGNGNGSSLDQCMSGAAQVGANVLCQCGLQSTGTLFSSIGGIIQRVCSPFASTTSPEDILGGIANSFEGCVRSKGIENLAAVANSCYAFGRQVMSEACGGLGGNASAVCGAAFDVAYDVGMCFLPNANNSNNSSNNHLIKVKDSHLQCRVDKAPQLLGRVMSLIYETCPDCRNWIDGILEGSLDKVQNLLNSLGPVGEFLNEGIEFLKDVGPIVPDLLNIAQGVRNCGNDVNCAVRLLSSPKTLSSIVRVSLWISSKLGVDVGGAISVKGNQIYFGGTNIMPFIQFVLVTIDFAVRMQQCAKMNTFRGFCEAQAWASFIGGVINVGFGIGAAAGSAFAANALPIVGQAISILLMIFTVIMMLIQSEIARQIEKGVKACVEEKEGELEEEMQKLFNQILVEVRDNLRTLYDFLSTANSYGASVEVDKVFSALVWWYILDKMFPAVFRDTSTLGSAIKVYKLLTRSLPETIFETIPLEGVKALPIHICVNSFHDGRNKLNPEINRAIRETLLRKM